MTVLRGTCLDFATNGTEMNCLRLFFHTLNPYIKTVSQHSGPKKTHRDALYTCTSQTEIRVRLGEIRQLYNSKSVQ